MECTKKHTNKLEGTPRLLSLYEKKNLKWNDQIYLEAMCGCWLRVHVNGKAKTWKRNPSKVQVPFKYGLYDYGYIVETTDVAVSQ